MEITREEYENMKQQIEALQRQINYWCLGVVHKNGEGAYKRFA